MRRSLYSSLIEAAGAMTLGIGRSRSLRMVLIAVTATMFAGAVLFARFNVVAIVIGAACLVLLASSLSNAGRLAGSLHHLEHRLVEVRVWGEPLSRRSVLKVGSISAISAGLLIYLREDADGVPTLLKIAQPGPARIEESRIEIDRASYISWGGAKFARITGVPAIVIVVLKEKA